MIYKCTYQNKQLKNVPVWDTHYFHVQDMKETNKLEQAIFVENVYFNVDL